MRTLYFARKVPVLSDLTAFLSNELVKTQDQQILATGADTTQGELPLQERNVCMTAISVAVSCTPED